MILRGKPKDIENYIKVNSIDSYKLHLAGFYPKYINMEYIYYKKDNDILIFIKENNISCIEE